MMRIKIRKDEVAQKQLGKIGGQSGIVLLPSRHFKPFHQFFEDEAPGFGSRMVLAFAVKTSNL